MHLENFTPTTVIITLERTIFIGTTKKTLFLTIKILLMKPSVTPDDHLTNYDLMMTHDLEIIQSSSSDCGCITNRSTYIFLSSGRVNININTSLTLSRDHVSFYWVFFCLVCPLFYQSFTFSSSLVHVCHRRRSLIFIGSD